MNFDENKPIYLQIASQILEWILEAKWLPDERIPSVRELAVELQVNPNTVMRSYDYLQNEKLIYNKRGIGYFLEKDALQMVHNIQKEIFFNEELPDLIKKMQLLQITFSDLENYYKK